MSSSERTGRSIPRPLRWRSGWARNGSARRRGYRKKPPGNAPRSRSFNNLRSGAVDAAIIETKEQGGRMLNVGMQEMVIIFLVALVLFGPKKLPELGRTIGKALTEFRRASSDLKASFEREMQTLERESHSLKQATETTANEIYSHSTFDYSYNEQSQVADASHAITD